METFKDIINGDKVVLVDFFATWCGPCKTMNPIIDEVASEMKGKMRTLRVDIDKNQITATNYQIQSVPTFMIFRKGKILWRHSGAISKSSLMEQLKYFSE